MKKGIIITIIVIFVVGIIATIGCCGFGAFKASQYTAESAKKVEEIIGTKLPPGYITFLSLDNIKSGKIKNMSMLMNAAEGSMLLIMEGPPLKTKEEQQQMIDTAVSEMQKQNNELKERNIQGPEPMKINNQEYPAYRLTETSPVQDSKKALMVFMNAPTKSLTVMYMAEEALYNEEKAKQFLQSIKL